MRAQVMHSAYAACEYIGRYTLSTYCIVHVCALYSHVCMNACARDRHSG